MPVIVLEPPGQPLAAHRPDLFLEREKACGQPLEPVLRVGIAARSREGEPETDAQPVLLPLPRAEEPDVELGLPPPAHLEQEEVTGTAREEVPRAEEPLGLRPSRDLHALGQHQILQALAEVGHPLLEPGDRFARSTPGELLEIIRDKSGEGGRRPAVHGATRADLFQPMARDRVRGLVLEHAQAGALGVLELTGLHEAAREPVEGATVDGIERENALVDVDRRQIEDTGLDERDGPQLELPNAGHGQERLLGQGCQRKETLGW